MTGHRRAAGLLLAAVTAVATALGVLLPAVPAAAEGDGTVTWSVRPSGPTGADGRSWVERELAPGESASEHMAVTNLGKSAVTFALSSADGYFTPAGRFTMRPGTEPSVAAGTWVDLPESVTVDPGGTAIVPLTIAVPDTATPGDHAAGVAASIRSQGEHAGSSVGVESRVGFRVMVRVAGEVRPSLEVAAESHYDMTWNPLRPGAMNVRYTARNTGNVRLDVRGTVDVDGGAVTSTQSERGEVIELLPGDERTIDIRVRGVWPLGRVVMAGAVESAVILPDGQREVREPMVQEIAAWAMPWPHVLLLLAAGLVVGGALWRTARRRNEMEARISAAREEGRREARER